MFPYDHIQTVHSWQDTIEWSFFGQWILSGAHTVNHPITGDVNPDYFTVLVCARFLYLKFAIPPLKLTSIYCEVFWYYTELGWITATQNTAVIAFSEKPYLNSWLGRTYVILQK